ncbi:MAG: RDD family protein [Candidatus Bathyarchaeia archaeon]
MFCTKCGKEVPEQAQFCPHCGNPTGVGTVVPKADASENYATLSQRFLAVLIDTIILAVVGIVIALVVGVLSFPFFDPFSVFFGATQIITFVLWIAYFTYFEATSGQSFGKQAMRIRVVDAKSGGSINGGRALLRNIFRIIDWLPAVYIIGLILIAATDRKQRLGDIVARTTVVQT